MKIFINPILLEHGLVLQSTEWLAEGEGVRKLPSYLNSLDRKKSTCKGMFLKIIISVLSVTALSTRLCKLQRVVLLCASEVHC